MYGTEKFKINFMIHEEKLLSLFHINISSSIFEVRLNTITNIKKKNTTTVLHETFQIKTFFYKKKN